MLRRVVVCGDLYSQRTGMPHSGPVPSATTQPQNSKPYHDLFTFIAWKPFVDKMLNKPKVVQGTIQQAYSGAGRRGFVLQDQVVTAHLQRIMEQQNPNRINAIASCIWLSFSPS